MLDVQHGLLLIDTEEKKKEKKMKKKEKKKAFQCSRLRLQKTALFHVYNFEKHWFMIKNLDHDRNIKS